jgi:hypothetical protein
VAIAGVQQPQVLWAVILKQSQDGPPLFLNVQSIDHSFVPSSIFVLFNANIVLFGEYMTE